MLTRDIAKLLVNETSTALQLNINVMNESGYIIASNDQARINQYHEASVEVMRTKQMLHLTEENIHLYKGVKMGINLPIEFQGEVIGALGITGHPNEIGDRAKLVKIIAELLVKQSYLVTQQEQLQNMKDSIVEEFLKDNFQQWKINRWLMLLNLPYDFNEMYMYLVEIHENTPQQMKRTQSFFQRLETEKHLFSKVDAGLYLIAIDQHATSTLKYIHSEAFLTLLEQSSYIRVATTNRIKKWSDFSIAYSECMHALKLADSKNQFINFSPFETEIMIRTAHSPFIERFKNRASNPVILKNKELLTALFAHNFNIQKTADYLYIHRNTLQYRIQKIQEETKLNPLSFTDAFQIQVLLWLYANEDHIENKNGL